MTDPMNIPAEHIANGILLKQKIAPDIEVPGIDLDCFVHHSVADRDMRKAMVALWPNVAAKAFAGEDRPDDTQELGVVNIDGAIGPVTYADMKAHLGDPWAVADRNK